jgi:hypothetical protein
MHSDGSGKLAVKNERKKKYHVRAEVLTTVSMRITLFWHMMPCTIVDMNI